MSRPLPNVHNQSGAMFILGVMHTALNEIARENVNEARKHLADLWASEDRIWDAYPPSPYHTPEHDP